MPKYSDKWIKCKCGKTIGGTHIKWKCYIFTCLKCDRKYRGGLWIRTVWWAFWHYRDTEGRRIT